MKHIKLRLWISIFFIFLVSNICLGDEVVVYVSEDQVFSEPILKDFEKATGIKVKAVYDTEEAKSTGVMNRLIAEKNNPQADVYWANEPIRAVVLKQKGISAPYLSLSADGIPENFKDREGYWTGFSARARVFIVNGEEDLNSILAYSDSRWKGKAVMANPLFGTTTTWIASLFTLWGNEKGKEFMEKMKMNKIVISTSNGESTDSVINGQYIFSLVDSDDATNAIRSGKKVKQVYPDQGPDDMGALILPNAVLLIKGSPHPENGKKLIDYLLSPETERKLSFADCAQIPLHPGVKTPLDVRKIEEIKTMKINYEEVAKKLQEIQEYLKDWVGY
ncbi:MAG: extracellular solute-binding protein [Chlamydiae bacterium]|nr:extracellular solute-binding protein [Chlamydiota bacterium]MBI3276358.1 extracellular solute-binding protein [Chlamydiota bacterium]